MVTHPNKICIKANLVPLEAEFFTEKASKNPY